MSGYTAARKRWPRIRIAGDTLEPFWFQAIDETGALLDLTSATATFKLVNDTTLAVVVNEASCTIVGSTVKYMPISADISTAGNFTGRFKLTLADATVGKVAYGYEIASDI